MSFYRSQNVLCWSNFFVPDQKFIYILWQSQTFCARQKDDLHLLKLFFVLAQNTVKFLDWFKKFGLAQNQGIPIVTLYSYWSILVGKIWLMFFSFSLTLEQFCLLKRSIQGYHVLALSSKFSPNLSMSKLVGIRNLC